MKLELDESRRLTGPNLLWQHPGALVDVFVEGIDKEHVAKCWQKWVDKLLPILNWENEKTTYRVHTHGISLAMSAPMDALYVACELAQHAWEFAEAELTGSTPPLESDITAKLQGELRDEINPELMQIIDLADQNGVTCITDDDFLSLGMGDNVDTWEVRDLPAPEAINWDKYNDIPLAFITGTNGKSTSVRLASQIAKHAGMQAGVTSTDFIRVGEHIIDTGDYSGPGGARMLIRDNRTEIAFLEVARGGILRRGLPVTHVNAALITNVAADHLGQYGIDSVEELALAKFVVAKGLDENGTLVLNGDNELVVNQSKEVNVPICWFSESVHNAKVASQISNGGKAVFTDKDELVYFDGSKMHRICKVSEIPMTFKGTAKHNIQNALGVVGLCFALGFKEGDIVAGLMAFGSNPEDNPGRGNLYSVNGCDVVVDFAHNEHSMRAVVDMANHMPAPQRIVMFGHAGDRSDEEIRDLTKAVIDLKADYFITADVPQYLRGREIGDVPALAKHCLLDNGIDGDKILYADGPLSGAKLALEYAEEGAVIILFTLSEREEVHQFLSQ